MWDVDELRSIITDRFTPDELIDILNIETEDIFDRFLEEILRVDWTEVLE